MWNAGTIPFDNASVDLYVKPYPFQRAMKCIKHIFIYLFSITMNHSKCDTTEKAMSQHKIGTSRYQMSFSSLEDQIMPENPVRIIEAFVDMLDLKTFGFQHVQTKQKDAPGFHPCVLLKIYFYGYFNRIRSSRKLEKECERNIEMRWLCEGQMPCYHMISTFRT